MPHYSDDFLLAAHGIAPLPITSGRLRRWIGRMIERQIAAEARNRDIGLTRDDVR